MPYPVAACRGRTAAPTSVAANPSITITTDGADATQATSTITASGAFDTTTDSAGNTVALDGDQNVQSNSAGTGWTATSSPASNPGSFVKDVAGAESAPTLSSGNGSVDGTAGTDATTEVAHVDFDGATGGTIKISGSTAIDWNADAATVESAIEAAIGEGVSVSGSNGVFDVTYDSAGAKTDLEITENLLTK